MKKALLFLVILISVSTYSFGQEKKESLKIIWPEEYKWKVVSNGEDSVTHTMTLAPENQSLEKWTIIGQMIAMKNNFHADDIEQVINTFTQAALQESSKAKYSVLEKNDKAKNFWAIFKVETPYFPNDPMPESQLWYAIQGNSTLYVNFVAVKEKTLSQEFINRWSKVFKSSQLSYK